MSKKGDDISYFTARHFRDVVAFIEAEKKVEIIGVPVKADVSGIFAVLYASIPSRTSTES